MSFILFDDQGKFLTGREMSQTDTSSQVELESGRRIKVKSSNVLLRFSNPSPSELMTQAQQLCNEIDLDLIWEFAPEGEFSFVAFAKDYYDENANYAQQVALLLALFNAPHYFRRSGKGVFKKAPEENVKAALLGLERKEQQRIQVETWANELIEGRCPDSVREQLYKILFKPDKNALEYKAVVQASKQSQVSVLELFKRCGAIGSAYEFHWQRFLYEFFPKGTEFAQLALDVDGQALAKLPVADVAVFSIDDSTTEEIDDALSVQNLGSGTVTLGIHIATPALGIAPNDAIDQVARQRLSTVYMPGWKIPMLPKNVIEHFSLVQGCTRPALSLYVTYDEATFELLRSETKIEQVRVAENIRYDLIEDVLNETALSKVDAIDHTFGEELKFLYRLVKHLKAQREIVRGKPETFARPDYLFHLVDEAGIFLNVEPTGQEKISIVERQRGSALDLIVSETMIVANCIWGGLLASLSVPGIYRTQAALRPGIKVRMGVKAQPHAGMGVPQYAWSTSPLRRYVDLLNQWQLIACVQHGATAALVAPFKPKEAEIFAIISAFEAAYSGYGDFQRGIERYWVFHYMLQNGVTELEAVVMRNGMVRALNLPFINMAVGAQNLSKDTLVKVKIAALDDMTLDAAVQVIEVVKLVEDSTQAEVDADDGDEGEQDMAGPIVLAVAVDDEDRAVNDQKNED